MENHIVSTTKALLQLSSSRRFAHTLQSAESFPMSCEGCVRRCLRGLSQCSSFRTLNPRRNSSRVAVFRNSNPVTRVVSLWKSFGDGESLVGEFSESSRLRRNSAFSSHDRTKRHGFWNFDITRSSTTSNLTSATNPHIPTTDVENPCEPFQRLENFYDDHLFVFPEENWDVDSQDASDSLKVHLDTLKTAAQVEDGSTVLCWGGSPALIHLLSITCPDSLVVSHCSLSVLAMIKESNDDIVCWHGDIADIPSSYGPFDSVFLNSLPALHASPVQLLKATARLCKPGGRIVISNSEGQKSLAACREKNPQVVLQDLPSASALERMIDGLPLKVVQIQDGSSYIAALEVTSPVHISSSDLNGSVYSSDTTKSKMRGDRTFDLVPKYPIRVRGHVVKGFGRGSKQMGIPTANIDPNEVPDEVLQMSKGVYCGWAQVLGENLDAGVHIMAMNIGNRPTFADADGVTVEVHILHNYGDVDFYGKEMRFVILGFIREEMEFKSLGELVERIHADIEIARKGLEDDDMQHFATDEVFVRR
ncbi:hypothetical protein MPTK1_3g20820 [Marchantia polymorpha subsp. ruderalis]|uniref:riboflavin kinase n=2 Tax=Marchantia polymorpha TaxID=3197 RepID=A0AAF6B316_MARPO|nr:hypothetical protein MARPO_0159s0012 [Marchantia polymorpha]BBN06400.1 hypothetical protein Mp_3g20820 [Marchantia polymorpha subsp. ruderalis]|eukprot:PTQ28595.1 hypothetical protein MARPO_0159s0012 [Marchantia polymorpha]